MSLYAIILAGGGGTRFWPLSRRGRPKQFLELTGPTSLFQATVDRVGKLVPKSNILAVTSQPYADQVPLPSDNVILEPKARNTAPAIALAMDTIAKKDPYAVAVVLPSDHLIADEDGLIALLQRAVGVAENNEALVTLGVVPSSPSTGFGYIEADEHGIVKQFHEKPDEATAKKYVKAGYLWNSGMFVWQARTLLDELKRHHPAFEASKPFESAPATSIDYAVLEKSRRVRVLPCDVGWDDLGTWAALERAGVAAQARSVVSIDAGGNVVYAPDKVVALLGVSDLVIVDTGDALLVCPKDRVEDVKAIVSELWVQGLEDVL